MERARMTESRRSVRFHNDHVARTTISSPRRTTQARSRRSPEVWAGCPEGRTRTRTRPTRNYQSPWCSRRTPSHRAAYPG
eukprot:1194587-Prorocentrum_minimum.AAC.3